MQRLLAVTSIVIVATSGCAGGERRPVIAPTPTPAETPGQPGADDLTGVPVPGGDQDAGVFVPPSNDDVVEEVSDDLGAEGVLPTTTSPGTTPPGVAPPDSTTATNGNTSSAAANNGNGATSSASGVAPNGWTGDTDDVPTAEPWLLASLDPASTVTDDGKLIVGGDATGAGAGTSAAGGNNAGGSGQGQGTGSDTSTKVTYNGRIKAILDAKCVSCHSPNGSRSNSSMSTFAAAKALGDSIVRRSEPGGGMPPGGPMSNADIEAIKSWQAGGYLEVNP